MVGASCPAQAVWQQPSKNAAPEHASGAPGALRSSWQTFARPLFLDRRRVLAQFSACNPCCGAAGQGDTQPWRHIGRRGAGAGGWHDRDSRRVGGRWRLRSRSGRHAIATLANESRAAFAIHSPAQCPIAGTLRGYIVECSNSQRAARGATGKQLDQIAPRPPACQSSGHRIEPLIVHRIVPPCIRARTPPHVIDARNASHMPRHAAHACERAGQEPLPVETWTSATIWAGGSE